MLWKGRQQSGNVEDRRGVGGMVVGGGIGSVIIAIIVMLFGGNPLEVLNQSGGGFNEGQTSQQALPPGQDEEAEFVGVVLQDTEDVWNKLFREEFNKDYPEPNLVLFSGQDQSGCGFASAATGPFYCPADEKVYIDLSFYNDLQSRFQAPGDFAMAYVIAHEVGHHVQHVLGTSGQVRQRQEGLSKEEINALSVKLELQADFYAGVWAHHAQQMKNILETGDIQEALTAANAIGDDRLQMEAQGYVVPDAFTHGTSEQRMYWFKRGYETGDINQGDTFNESM